MTQFVTPSTYKVQERSKKLFYAQQRQEMVSTEMERYGRCGCRITVGNGYDTHVNTFVNVVATLNEPFERVLNVRW